MITIAAVLPIVLFNVFNNSAFKSAMEALPRGGLEIASDSAFANKTTNFNSDQTVYVRATADNSGSDSHVLNLRDSNYNLITTYNLAKSQNQFTASFAAPNSAGTYSLDANIKSGDSVVNLVKTIQVDGGGSSSNVNVKINSQTNTNSQVLGDESKSPEPVVTPTPVPAVETPKENFFQSMWNAIAGFFKNIF